jgi:catechol 2,3-dioxygenase-like lactoylglutathione lyase family enzyme
MDASAPAVAKKPSVIQGTRLSHGTLMVANLRESRKFYEEFLGLEVVRHGERSMMFRLNTGMHVVAVKMESGKLWDMHALHHWGIDLPTREAVDQAYQDTLRLKDTYRIQKIQKPVMQHGVYSYYLKDLDNNWWEIQHADHQNERAFARGDVYPTDD